VLEDEPGYVLTPHARFQMQRRGIDEAIVHRVMTAPEQQFDLRPGRAVRQSRVEMGRTYLVRVVVDVERSPAEVVTVYRTTKISKYWREAG
jgi:hypothetical protein